MQGVYERLTFLPGDGGDHPYGACCDAPRVSCGMHGATGWGDDDVAAFTSGLGQNLDLVFGVLGQLLCRRWTPSHFRVAGHLVVADTVDQVQAAAGCPFGVTRVDEHVQDVSVAAGF